MDTRKDILDDALTAWRQTATAETLGEPARSALFNDVRELDDRAQAPFVPGITRAWRWAFLGSVPVVALSLVLIVAGDHRPAAEARLSTAKVDGQVIFTLANGGAEHRVYRSADPRAFDRASGVKMARNRYIENVTGGPTLVFYRID